MKKIIWIFIFLIVLTSVIALESNSSSYKTNFFLGTGGSIENSTNYKVAEGIGQSIIRTVLGTIYKLQKGLFYIGIKEDITAPIVSLDYPTDALIIPINNVTFNISATDDFDLSNCTLYGNFSGAWQANQTANLSGTYGIANWSVYNLSTATYLWNAYCCDTSNNCAFNSVNFTFTVGADVTSPTITAIRHTDPVYTQSNVQFTADVYDDYLNTVLFYFTDYSNDFTSYAWVSFEVTNYTGTATNRTYNYTLNKSYVHSSQAPYARNFTWYMWVNDTSNNTVQTSNETFEVFPVCGDGICESGESPNSCPFDCGAPSGPGGTGGGGGGGGGGTAIPSPLLSFIPCNYLILPEIEMIKKEIKEIIKINPEFAGDVPPDLLPEDELKKLRLAGCPDKCYTECRFLYKGNTTFKDCNYSVVKECEVGCQAGKCVNCSKSCQDKCIGNYLYYDGYCEMERCVYKTEECGWKCEEEQKIRDWYRRGRCICKENRIFAENPEECCSKTIEGSTCVEERIELLSIHPLQFNLKIEAGKVFKDIVAIVNKGNDSIYVSFSTSESIKAPHGVFEIKPISRKEFEFEFTASKYIGLIEEQNIRVSITKGTVKMIKDLPVYIEVVRTGKEKPLWSIFSWVGLAIIIIIGIAIYVRRKNENLG